MGDDNEAICGYCSTRFVYDDTIGGVCAPPECELVDTRRAMSRRAIIAGAGIGGLATAMALSQGGFRRHFVRAARALEEFGAGLQLTPNATRVLCATGRPRLRARPLDDARTRSRRCAARTTHVLMRMAARQRGAPLGSALSRNTSRRLTACARGGRASSAKRRTQIGLDCPQCRQPSRSSRRGPGKRLGDERGSPRIC